MLTTSCVAKVYLCVFACENRRVPGISTAAAVVCLDDYQSSNSNMLRDHRIVVQRTVNHHSFLVRGTERHFGATGWK